MSTVEKSKTAKMIPAGVWRVDPAHSNVGFSVKHMMIATVHGRFGTFEGTLDVGASGVARARGTIAAASIDTGDADRDRHLRSADFLDVETYPEITFDAQAIEPSDDENLLMAGHLSIAGVSRVIELDVTMQGVGRDPWGNDRLAVEVRGEIDREQFGLTWNQALESGGVLVGRKVKLELDLSTVREPVRAAA